MGRGRLRVLLGAAPGVGKTYAMLEEGRRLRDEGKDVVVAVVETHGRAATAALLDGLEVVPRRTVEHRGVTLTDLDLPAVLLRRPDLALVDELAHSNAPGLEHEKRWQDVDALLDAGIDVVSTVNIQHIESLNDVVEKITGVVQRETIPDGVLRAADQIEVVDLAPQALRDRLSGGYVYPAERIDAALSNYFRLGNLTALRELALLWLADEVDAALRLYRTEHGIDSTWEARERVVVTLTGGPEGETLIRRGARIAARSAGGQLLALHVASQDGLRGATPGALARQRALVEQLGGTFHQVVGDDVPRALVDFARGVNATQLVIGVSRRGRLAAALSGPGIGATVTREAGNIDVHIVNHSAAGGGFALPPVGGALTVRRQVVGFLLALVVGPLLTWLLVASRGEETIISDVLAYQLLVVVVALVGGVWPAVYAAVLSGLTIDFFFIEPFHTVTVAEPFHLLALVLYVVIACLVSFVVDRAARTTRAARRSAAESEVLATVAGSVMRGQDAVQALVDTAYRAFGTDGARLVAAGDVLAAHGDTGGAPSTTIAVGDDARLELFGPDLPASERRLLQVIAAQLEAALEHTDLAQVASEVDQLAALDRVRSALLSALSHDLRRPLTAATAAVSGLRSTAGHDGLSAEDRSELLRTADESLTSLAGLLTDLLDVSRLEAGVLAVARTPVEAVDAILPALDELALGPDRVELDLDLDVPAVLADPVLLERVVVNLLANAHRHAPPGTRVRLTTSALGASVEIRVVDHGPGIPTERREDVFVPFQRLGDTDNTTGLGLGLALSKGFVEGMGGRLTPEDTPGGGLTMVVSLPAVASGPAAVADAASEVAG
ncbi:ATP-binding protein [Cellulomonas shaoxiangyii]|uniref:histidine kinase n=1 Tax=Cellulomonas shaoxiangyii TaxID=2566013 RepID=A0A4P7SQI1_9CELL|nr:ATP-binding protein [Cellulomonas shaoxiangyii]QCB95274.1 sensor histidine kinase KdpD [Cellulomonas shaoxiangyii]TGY86900.1 sensor histidine kinase KdpD [Cellulomonas shaoxiangyii]